MPAPPLNVIVCRLIATLSFIESSIRDCSKLVIEHADETVVVLNPEAELGKDIST